MANFTGSECQYCHNKFTDNDDVVVCPECGSPYHRDCYTEAGECINRELHEKGETWSAAAEEKDDGGESELRCPRCGQVNPPTGIFCNKCGMPLKFDAGQRPFNGSQAQGANGTGPMENMGNMGGFGQAGGFGSPFMGQDANRFFGQQINKDTDLDGNTIGDYVHYTGSNSTYFLLQFFRFAKSGVKISVNFVALLFTEFYFFYRRMYKQGIVAFILLFLLSVPYVVSLLGTGLIANVTMPDFMANNIEKVNLVLNACSFVACMVRLVFGMMANYWYYRKAKSSLLQIKEQKLEGEKEKEAFAAAGGTSAAAVIVSVTIYFAAVIGVLMAAIAL